MEIAIWVLSKDNLEEITRSITIEKTWKYSFVRNKIISGKGFISW